MKKTLAILTLVVMLAALIVPAAMAVVDATAACDHPGVYIASEETVGPRYYSDFQHGYATKRVARCTACNVVLTTSYANWTNLSAHVSPDGLTSVRHNSDGTHTYRGFCNVCASSYTVDKNCSGPPCPTY